MQVKEAGSRTITGYLSGYANPQFSGLARIVVRTRKSAKKYRPGSFYGGVVESGYGTRCLVDVLGCGRGFSKESGEVKCRWTFDNGLLVSVQRCDGYSDMEY